MWLRSDDFADAEPIPGDYSLCVIDPAAHVTFARNLNQHLEWGDVPEGLHSFALLVIDADVPTSPEDVNQGAGRCPQISPEPTSPTGHLSMSIPLPAPWNGALTPDGVTPKGKPGLT